MRKTVILLSSLLISLFYVTASGAYASGHIKKVIRGIESVYLEIDSECPIYDHYGDVRIVVINTNGFVDKSYEAGCIGDNKFVAHGVVRTPSNYKYYVELSPANYTPHRIRNITDSIIPSPTLDTRYIIKEWQQGILAEKMVISISNMNEYDRISVIQGENNYFDNNTILHPGDNEMLFRREAYRKSNKYKLIAPSYEVIREFSLTYGVVPSLIEGGINRDQTTIQFDYTQTPLDFSISPNSEILYYIAQFHDGKNCNRFPYTLGDILEVPVASYPGDEEYQLMVNIRTPEYDFEGIELSGKVRPVELFPTDYTLMDPVTINANWVEGNANVVDRRVYISDGKIAPTEGCEIHVSDDYITGLEPAKRNYLIFQADIIDSSGTQYTVESPMRIIDAGEVSMDLNPIQVVASGVAVLQAQTNISVDDSTIGFQWKKSDAPENIQPNEGTGTFYNGLYEGVLQNLNPEKYYDVRVFYRSYNGNLTTSPWIAFDPSDFSYMEPTLSTYDASIVTSTSAQLNGYIRRGSDSIDEQGFEYWIDSDNIRRTLNRVRLHPSILELQNESITSKTIVDGQDVHIIINNLNPGTTYGFRTYISTANNDWFGPEILFTTADGSSISNISQDEHTKTSIGLYDMHGRTVTNPSSGIVIERFSDGSCVKKVLK